MDVYVEFTLHIDIHNLLQIGWLLVRKHPEVIRKGSKIDLSDLRSDPVVMFQHRHYLPLALAMAIAIPTAIPVCIKQSF